MRELETGSTVKSIFSVNIDNKDLFSDLLAFLSLGLFYAVILLIAVFGPVDCITIDKTQSIRSTLQNNTVEIKNYVSNLKSINQHVDIYFAFTNSYIFSPFNFTAELFIINMNFSKIFDFTDVSVDKHNRKTSNIKVYTNRHIKNHDTYNYSIIISGDFVKDAQLINTFKYINSNFTYLLISLRSFFPLVLFLFLLLKISQHFIQSTEQKITTALTIFLIIYDNPFMIFYYFFSWSFVLYLDIIFKSLFYGFLAFYTISMLKILRDNEPQTKHLIFYGVFVVFYLVQETFSLRYSFRNHSNYYEERRIRDSILNLLFIFSYSIVLVYEFIKTLLCVDSMYAYRYIIYLCLMIIFLSLLFTSMFANSFQSYKMKTIFPNVTANVFVIVMEYLHGHYEPKIELMYQYGNHESDVEIGLEPENEFESSNTM
ncbi:hypothetical protein TRFO_37400 [Tritrichomonas foetus]|uniref:Wntless-like transmembrane domain-containing protein n=1 Tax=Tritrichomonas foetus TaxID=1144522 RepID=A0A1J4JDT2_9EUKA|nr:hypothetical protein TRFO_37400 [Tritrichomonas foetus]|eukprot:OHS96447.1 hypothetical protein TRFO_37400 [Tritrichomonas foetus]